MANAGYSSDYKLCRAITDGIWNKKYGNQAKYEIIPLPQHKDEDDIHQTALKNLVYKYCDICFSNLEDTSTKWLNIKLKRENKVIYQMNQYRQKHWYWKAII